MDNESKLRLNRFFVSTFNKILSLEEKALKDSGIKDLSVKEMHIIEAVNELEKIGKNTMSKISLRVDISVGALTTAVNFLVNKGYLIRGSKEGDRRVVMIELTKKGVFANMEHEKFHEEMLDMVGRELSVEQLSALTGSLDRLTDFFSEAVGGHKK